MSEFTAVLKEDELRPGEVRTVEVDGEEVAVANVDGVVYAIDNRCPHADGPLGDGFLDEEILTCPLHYWEFDVTTGDCLTEPDQPVPRFEAKIEDGVVMVRRGSPEEANESNDNGAGS